MCIAAAHHACRLGSTIVAPMNSDTAPSSTAATIGVVEERLVVDTEVKETGALRVRIETELHDERVTLTRTAEEVVVERVQVQRRVDQRIEPWFDGDVLVVPVYAEVPVVERHLYLVEELRLRPQTFESSTTQSVPLARQRAIVERRQTDGRWVIVDPGDQ